MISEERGKCELFVRRFEPRDFSEVMMLDAIVDGDHDPYLFTFFYENYPTTFLVAEVKGTIVGLIMGFKQSPMEGRIFWLAVRPEYWGRGIGRELMNCLLTTLKRLGIMRVILEVRWGNKKAQMLYKDLGFGVVSCCPNYYPDGEDGIIMIKPF